jgi:hypothetical protein
MDLPGQLAARHQTRRQGVDYIDDPRMDDRPAASSFGREASRMEKKAE